MLRKIGRILTILLSYSSIAYAGDVNITLTADKTQASMEDTILLQVSVGGGSGSQPVIAHAEDFDVRFAGTSSQVQIINGHMSSSKTSNFALTPRKPGTFTIGPAQVVVDGKTYESNPVTLTISHGASPSTRDARDGQAYVEVEVSNKTPYIGEQVLYTIRFYTQIPAQNVQMKTPEFDGFIKESLGDSKSYQRVMNGQAWQVSELQWALYPMSAGELSIPAPRLIAEFLLPSRSRLPSLFDDPFFSNMDRFFREPQQRTLTGEPVTMEVRSLPESGKPANFSGLVGSFSIAMKTNKPQSGVEGEAPVAQQSSPLAGLPMEGATRAPMIVEAGQSATMTVTVKGDGDLRSLADLKWELPEGVKVYDDQPSVTTTPSQNGLLQAKTFRKAVVPLRAGDLSLPPLTLNYFDPRLGEYKTLETGSVSLKVRPASHPDSLKALTPETQSTGPSPIQIIGEKLRPAGNEALTYLRGPHAPWVRKITMALILATILGIAMRQVIRQRRRRLESDPGYLKRKKALRNALRSLRKLPEKSGRDFYEAASLILRDFLGDKFGIDGRALTPLDIEKKITHAKITEESLKKLVQLLRQCDEGVYGGMSLSIPVKETLVKDIRQIIVTL